MDQNSETLSHLVQMLVNYYRDTPKADSYRDTATRAAGSLLIAKRLDTGNEILEETIGDLTRAVERIASALEKIEQHGITTYAKIDQP